MLLKAQTSSTILLCSLCFAVDAFILRNIHDYTMAGIQLSPSREGGAAPNTFQRPSRKTISPVQERIKGLRKNIEATDDVSSLIHEVKSSINFSESEIGLIVLFTVPIAWGSYGPSVTSLYTLEPKTPGFVFSTCYFLVSGFASLGATFWQNAKFNDGLSLPKFLPASAGLELGSYVYLANFLHVIGLQSVPAGKAGFLFQLTTVMVPLLEALFARDLLAVPSSTWAACVLALAGIFVMGLEPPFVGSEASNVEARNFERTASKDVINPHLATSGIDTQINDQIVLDYKQMMLDSTFHGIPDSGSMLLGILTPGEAMIVGAAFLYSLQILRLSRWSRDYSPLQIMTGKTVAESLLSMIFLGGTTWLANSGADVTDNTLLSFLSRSGNQATEFFERVSCGLAEESIPISTVEHFVGTTLWTGLVTTCYLVFAQSYGQKRVKASDANLIYSLQPLFTSIFAYYLLGETLKPIGYVGGALIGAGVFLAASKSLAAEETN